MTNGEARMTTQIPMTNDGMTKWVLTENTEDTEATTDKWLWMRIGEM
jgi:hypothetical protein